MQSIRNIAIIAHVDHGKTTLVDKILLQTQLFRDNEKTGELILDNNDLERERGITIIAKNVSVNYKGTKINIIDTPGHVDFTVEVERSLRVLDGAVAVFDGVAGVEPQSETVWRQADRYKVPRIAFINKLDRTGAVYTRTYDMLIERLNAPVVLLQLPIGTESEFAGIVDLIDMKAYVWDLEANKGDEFRTEEIPANMLDEAKAKRAEMIEKLADVDDSIMELFMEEKEPSTEQIIAAIRKGTVNFTVVPVIMGSAFKNKGVQQMLDAVTRYLPSPLDIGSIKGFKQGDASVEIERAPADTEPFSALAFKIMSDPHLGKLTYIRIYSGKLEPGTGVLNSTKDRKERIGKIYQMHANKRDEKESASAGSIVAVMGLKDTTTGDTLCDPDKPVVLESMDFPDPVIHVAIEPKTKNDQDKLATAIQRLAEEDPTFHVRGDEETGQTIIGGMGELHLEVLVDRMKREFKVEANVGKPQVAYRETITKKVEKVDYTHKKQSGGAGQFARVIIDIEPNLTEGGGYEFINKVTGGRIPREYIPSVDDGAQEAMTNGVLAGYQMVDIKVTLQDGAYHDVDSSELAFKIAGSMAFKEAARKAHPVLLEPMMDVEVVTPEDFMGDVIGDLNSRRGQIQAMDERAGARVVKALVPLSEMFGYVGDLRSKTQGRASYTMQFHSYAQVPDAVSKEIVAKVRGE